MEEIESSHGVVGFRNRIVQLQGFSGILFVFGKGRLRRSIASGSDSVTIAEPGPRGGVVGL
jgi:hypothetical protein